MPTTEPYDREIGFIADVIEDGALGRFRLAIIVGSPYSYLEAVAKAAREVSKRYPVPRINIMRTGIEFPDFDSRILFVHKDHFYNLRGMSPDRVYISGLDAEFWHAVTSTPNVEIKVIA